MKEMEFYFQEIKFQARVDSLDIETKTIKVLRKMTLNLRCWTSFQDGGHIRLTWSMFHIDHNLVKKLERWDSNLEG